MMQFYREQIEGEYPLSKTLGTRGVLDFVEYLRKHNELSWDGTQG